MSNLLARLDGPPFPSSEDTIVSGMLTQLPVANASLAQSQTPGPSGRYTLGNGRQTEAVSRDMFSVLCEQVAILADMQTRERERLEHESKEGFQAVKASLELLSQRLVSNTMEAAGPSLPACDKPTPQALGSKRDVHSKAAGITRGRRE